MPKARRRWARTDPILARLAKEFPPAPRPIGDTSPFVALVTSITHQQVSLGAGRAIFARLDEATGRRMTPRAVIDMGPEGLRGAGLSRPKVAYVLDLAERANRGDVDFDRLSGALDAEVIETLTAVKGIGVWTAKMFLLFHLGRPDVLPHEDLGVQIAVAQAYGVPREVAAKKIQQLGPAWSPYSSVAALTLWNWRHVMADQEKAARAKS